MNKKFFLMTLICLTFTFVSVWAANQKEIPTDASVEELKQLAYELSAKGKYHEAEKYYQTIIERYGMNAQVLIASEFEIAHIYVKMHKYDEAEPRLRKILNYYEASETYLPPQYKRLAEIDIEKIQNEKLKKELKNKKSKKAKKNK